MNMIEVIMTVCALANPSQCEEQHLQYAGQGSLRQCVMNAQPYLAEWINEHPKWSIVRWRCDVPHSREKADARGPARPA
jgi:hypothetical protein